MRFLARLDDLADRHQTYFVEMVVVPLQWLNDWPVGLKLNTPLSQFFCSSLTFVVRAWGGEVFFLI